MGNSSQLLVDPLALGELISSLALETDEIHASEVIRELRETGADAHHRLHLQAIEGKADAAAHALERARESGVPKALRVELASWIFQEIVEEIPRKPRERPLHRRRLSRAQ
jgi:hypothetical protein